MKPPGRLPESKAARECAVRARAAAVTLEFAIETFEQPAFVVDAKAHLKCANRAAVDDPFVRGLIGIGHGGRVTLGDAAAQCAFERALRGIDENAPSDITVRSEHGQAEALISIYPISAIESRGAGPETAGEGENARVALVIVRPLSGAMPASRMTMLRHLYGLTPAESKLAGLLARGTSLNAASCELGVSKETARTQLKAIFAKTDTHRQPELVALLAKLFQGGKD